MKRALVTCFAALSILAGNASAAPRDLVTPGHLQGTGVGTTVLVSPGVYTLSGSFTDPTNGIVGRYEGDLVNTGDYSTCAGGHVLGCLVDPNTGRQYGNCNIVHGSIRLHWAGGHSIELQFGSNSGRVFPSVCQEIADPTIHDLLLSVFGNSPPAFPTHKLGRVDWADGLLRGASHPSTGGNYRDTFSFSIDFGAFTNS